MSLEIIAILSDIADVKTIVLNPSAARALDKLPPDARERIVKSLTAYAIDGSGDVKAMRGTGTVRLRIGDYRVIMDEASTTLIVLALGHRRDIYR